MRFESKKKDQKYLKIFPFRQVKKCFPSLGVREAASQNRLTPRKERNFLLYTRTTAKDVLRASGELGELHPFWV